MPPADRPFPGFTVGRLATLLGALAGLAVLATLGAPGITIDEPLDVRPGRSYVSTLRARGLGFFEPATIDRVFADNAEHPPMGRWLLGLASTLGEPFEFALGGPDPFRVHAGRVAPALAFALLVALVAREAGRKHGRVGAGAAGFALVAMPRCFAHAHLAALDTFIALFWVLALIRAGRAIDGPRPVAAMALAGAFWSLALLTKIHAWFLPPIVLAWAFGRLRPSRALAAFAAWLAVGLLGFVAGWPWLWADPIGRLAAYLGTGVERVSLRVEYLGRIYADVDVPWHYPWLYFAATVPIGLHICGLLGASRAWRDRRADPLALALVGSIVLFLALFSTRVPVYDGERLFLVAFPLWAIAIGAGFARLWARAGRLARGGLVALLAAQGFGLATTHPFGLSYYNFAVGGLPGAERLGLEPTYWGDAVDPVLLARLAELTGPGESAALAPTLHHLQATAALTPALLAKGVRLLDESEVGRADWVVVSRRRAYWRPEVRDLISKSKPEAVRSRSGVWLSAIYRGRSRRSP